MRARCEGIGNVGRRAARSRQGVVGSPAARVRRSGVEVPAGIEVPALGVECDVLLVVVFVGGVVLVFFFFFFGAGGYWRVAVGAGGLLLGAARGKSSEALSGGEKAREVIRKVRVSPSLVSVRHLVTMRGLR